MLDCRLIKECMIGTWKRKKTIRKLLELHFKVKHWKWQKNLGYESFKASNGWLAKFVRRHAISFKENKNPSSSKPKNEEKTSTFNPDFYVWSKSLSSVIDKYSKDEIFCAFQIGLFFRAVPDDVSNLLEKTCADGTLSSERFTILLCANMSGIKEKPLIIADIPDKEIENLKLTKVYCKSNSSAWMTKNIINEWLTNLNKRMIEQNKNIVLFLGPSIPHHDCQLSNINAIYFPNMFSSSQNISQSITQNLKVMYRFQMLRHLIALKQKSLNNSITDYVIDVGQALTWIAFSWSELSSSVIHKCFENFLIHVTPVNICDDEPSVTLNDISDLLCAYDSFVSPADFIGVDDCLVTVEQHSESVEILVNIDPICADSDEENLNESKNVLPNNIVSNFYSESLKNLKCLEQFYLSQNDSVGASLAKQLIDHHNGIINSKKKS